MTQRGRVLLQPAYVLHRRPYRDSSLLLDVFTREFGRLALVARGARQVRSRSAGLLQPFQPVLLSWAGSGELATLAGVEAAGAARWLAGTALLSGLYLNELIVRLLHRYDPHPDLYADYEAVLAKLAGAAPAADPALEAALRIFEKRLLAEIGYGLVLEHEADSDRLIEAERVYAYHMGAGPLPCAEAAAPALAVRGSTLLDLARECLDDPGSLREAKRLMRAALAAQLGDKPLASRRLFTASP